MVHAPTLSPPPTTAKWRVIFQDQKNKFFLDILQLPYSQSASDIVNELRKLHVTRDLDLPQLRRLARILLFRKPVFGIGSLAPVSLYLW